MIATTTAGRAPASAATAGEAGRGRHAVDALRLEALALGRQAPAELPDADAVVAELVAGLTRLADPEYLAGQQRVAPGIGEILGVRGPLLGAVSRGIRAATRRDRPTTLIALATRMCRESPLELHWLAFDVLAQTVRAEPEQTWQIIRAEATRAGDWITVDWLAHTLVRGILAEPYRWAELEQLVYSPSRWERRLAASTIATVPYVDRRAGRTPDVARRGLAILRELVGDHEPDVQKAMAWALRSLTLVDLAATEAWLRDEASHAAATGDGHRAWVVRAALEKLPPGAAGEIRSIVGGIRKRPGAPSTSRAAAAAAAFMGLGLDVPPAARPVVPRP